MTWNWTPRASALRRLVQPLRVRHEFNLGDELESRPHLLLSHAGERLLVLAREFVAGGWGCVDFLAIDASGVVHIIELKRRTAGDAVVAQVFDYLSWVKALNRVDLVRTFRERFHRDLETDFYEAFGVGLPEDAGSSNALVVVAEDFTNRSRRAFGQLALFMPIALYRYSTGGKGLRMIPVSLEEGSRSDPAKELFNRISLARRRHWGARVGAFPVDAFIFWVERSPHLGSRAYIDQLYRSYLEWFATVCEEQAGPRPLNLGQFGRALEQIRRLDGGWQRKYASTNGSVDSPHRSGDVSLSSYRRAGHSRVVLVRQRG